MLTIRTEKRGLSQFRANNWHHNWGVGTPRLVVLASGSGGMCSVCMFPKPGVSAGVCIANLKLGELVSWATLADGQRGYAGTQWIQKHICACESIECCVRAFMTGHQSPPAKEEEGGSAVYTECFMEAQAV